MAFVDIPGRESLEVPDSWGRDEVTDFVRQTYPDLFEPAVVNTGPSPVTLGPDRAPLTPEARQARIASIQGTPAENRRFAEEQSRIADLDALDAAREAGGITGFLGTSPIMEGPRRVVAGAANFLRVPGALANIALTPAFIPEATRPTAERIGKFLQDLDTGIQGMQEQLLVSERPDADPTLRDIAKSFREVGPAAGVADALTLGVNALADSAAYILPSGLVSQALRRVPSLTPRMANALGPMISVAPVETAEALSEYVEAAEDPVLARVAAPIVGAINGALGSITDSKILDRLGAGNEARRGVAKFLVGQVLGEGATEAAQEATTIGGRFAATGDVGPDPLNRIGTAALGGVLAGGGMGATVAGINRVTAPPPLGRRERKLALDFAEIASQEGVADLVDFIPEAKFTPEGAPIEGEFVGGRFRVYTPNIRNESRLRGALREEKAHGWIASPEGQTALNTFIAEHPLTPEDQQRLRDDGYLPQESEPSDAYLRRLSDEFVAKLNRDPKWKQWIGEAVAWVKNAIGVSLTNTQAGRLMLRNLRKAAPVAPTPRALPGPRYALAPERAEPLLTEIRTQYPSAPPIILSPDRDPRGASFDGQNILVSPQDLPGNPAAAKSTILSAMVESGLNLFPESFIPDTFTFLRETDPLGTGRLAQGLGLTEADLRTRQGQAAVVSRALRLQAEGRRLRPWLRRWMRRLRIAPTDQLGDQLQRLAQGILTAYENTEPLPSRQVTPQDQIYADLFSGVWRYAKPFVDRIRDLALDSRFAAEDERMFRNMASRMRSLVEAGRARDIGAGKTDRTWDARNPKFVEELRDAGVPVSESDERLHGIYRLEAEARDLVSVLDRAEDLAGLLTRLESTAPGFDRTADEEALARLRKRINAANPDALARAEDLRLQNARRPESKAAMEVLLDPQIRAWLEIIEQIEQSGATPREDVSGPTANAVQTATDTLFLSWRPFRERTAKVYREFLETEYPKRLKALKEKLEGFASDRVKAHVAVGEILSALAGTADLSGSVEGRETAMFLRENDELLRRFIVALAQADPDSTVARLRDQVLQAPDTAPIQEAARNELVREILETPVFENSTPDDVRALFGVDSRTANPGLYEWFSRQPQSVKKEVVRNAMRGVVDARLPRKQVGILREAAPRPPNEAEIQERFWSAFQQEMDARGLAALGAAARSAGISTGALTRLLEFIRQSPGARNAVTSAYDAVSRELRESALAAILEIEAAGDKAEVAERVAPAIERFVRARGRATDALRGVEQDIAELEARRKALEMLRDAGAATLPESELAVSEMLYDAADGGVLFRSFIRADGTEQPEIRVGPRDEYTPELLVRLIEWQQSATAAANAGTNSEPITRGLLVAVPLADFYIDAKFTPEQITSTIAPGRMGDRLTGLSGLTVFLNIATRETLTNMVPGVMGRRLKLALEGLVKAGRTVDKLIRRNASRNRKLMEAAAESLDLDLRSEGHATLLRRARNEVAHRMGRQFEGDVGVGTSLITLPGRKITIELVNLLRNDRAIGREAQNEGLQRPYGGTRILLPGERAVRPPGETGMFGLARIARRDIYRRLAEVYRTRDPVQIAAFWDSADSENGLLWHILDSGRADLGLERDRDLLPAERRIANRIFQGAPQPKTLDEVVGLLVTETGLSRSEVRAKLLGELEAYGRIAMSRIPADQGTAPKTRAIEVFGESDLTEFTQAATPLLFPSSWYTYGVSDSLQAFYERTADPDQVKFLTALKEGAEALTTRASEIQRAIADARANGTGMDEALAQFRGDILWHTNDLWSGKTVTPDRAMVAVNRMRTRAGRLEAEITLLQSPAKAWHSWTQRAVSTFVPWMLMWLGPFIKNVASGPWAARFAYRPTFGVNLATTKAFLDMLVSPTYMAWDRLLRLAESSGIKFESREERQTYLESAGIAGSFSRAELGEAEAWTRGEVPGPVERALAGSGDVARRIGEVTGTPLGDTILNRYITVSVIPVIVWRLKRVAAVWKGRLARQGVTSRDDSRYALNDEDIGDSATLRDWLAPMGNPETVLETLDSVPIRKFWRHPLGRTMGARIINQINAATRGNRPTSNPLLTLLGWSANMINQIAADARNTPDTTRFQKVSGLFTRTLSWALLSSFGFYWAQYLARAGFNLAQTAAAETLQQIFLGIDPDDDDPEGIFEALVKLTQAIREEVPGAPLAFDAAARVANAMKAPPATGDPTPFDASFWNMPSSDIVVELMKSVPKGLGFDPENPRLPALGIMSQMLQGAVQMAGGAKTYIEDPSPESWEGSKADLREGTRKLLAVFSMAGQFAYNMAVPESVQSRQVKAEIVDAARGIGVEPAKPPGFRSLKPPTPVEQALREAARRGDAEAMRRIAGFAFNRARNRALDAGKTEQEAQSAGEQAVKGLLVQLDPIRDALGSAITEEQYAKLAPKLGPKVREAIAQKDRAVDVISNTPPDSMRPFQATGAMLSPIKQAPGRRSSFRASRRRGRGRVPRYLLARRRRTRRVRRPRLRGR